MGAPLKELDTEILYDLLHSGKDQKQVAVELGVSVPTLTKRIADLQEKTGLLLKYRDIQNLHLTELQARVLEAITPEKIQLASLTELVTCFRILKDKELVSLGKPNEIKGLVGYLIQIEKEQAIKDAPPVDVESLEVCQETVKTIVDADYLPDLN